MATTVSFADPTSLYNNDQMLDLLRVTIPTVPWDGKYEVLHKYNAYPVVNNWFQERKVLYQGGTQIIKNVRVTESGGAHFTTPYATEEPSVEDLQARVRIEWVQLTHDYSISRQEMADNRGRNKLIDLIKNRRGGTQEGMANVLEEYAWQVPDDSGDTLHPLGIPYWIGPIVTSQTAGHNGNKPIYKDGNDASDCGGINPSTTSPDQSRWKNYNDRWTAATSFDGTIVDSDVIKVTRMLRRLRFKPPVMVSDATATAANPLKIYTGEEVLEAFEDRARDNNDQLGADVGKYAGATLIKNIPIELVEYLNYAQGNDTTYPMYAINHAYFHAAVKEGDYFRETGPMNSVKQHDVFTTFLDIRFNFLCTNRRTAGGIISAVVA